MEPNESEVEVILGRKKKFVIKQVSDEYTRNNIDENDRSVLTSPSTVRSYG